MPPRKKGKAEKLTPHEEKWKAFRNTSLSKNLYIKELGGEGHCFFYVIAGALNLRSGMKKRYTQDSVRKLISQYIFAHENDPIIDRFPGEKAMTVGTLLDSTWLIPLSKRGDADELPDIYQKWTSYREEHTNKVLKSTYKAVVQFDLEETCLGDTAIIQILPYVFRDVEKLNLTLVIVAPTVTELTGKKMLSVVTEPLYGYQKSDTFIMIYQDPEGEEGDGHYRLLGWNKNKSAKEPKGIFQGMHTLPDGIQQKLAEREDAGLPAPLKLRLEEDKKKVDPSQIASKVRDNIMNGLYTVADYQKYCSRFSKPTLAALAVVPDLNLTCSSFFSSSSSSSSSSSKTMNTPKQVLLETLKTIEQDMVEEKAQKTVIQYISSNKIDMADLESVASYWSPAFIDVIFQQVVEQKKVREAGASYHRRNPWLRFFG